MTNKALLATCAALALWGCGDNNQVVEGGNTCGEGTTEVDGVCVADDVPVTECGEGTMEVMGVCVRDPFDRDAPGPVQNMAVATNSSGFDVSWTNPPDADFAGVVVVYLNGQVGDAKPADGSAIAVGDTIGGHSVIFVGTAETTAHVNPLFGLSSYAAWAFDDAMNYSPVRVATGKGNAPQTATILLDLDLGTATVTNQPANLTLTTSTPNFNDGSDLFTFDLELQNDTAGFVFAPKLLFVSTEGDLSSDGDLSDTPYREYGLEAMTDGDARTRSITINNITSTTGTVSLTVTLRDGSPMIAANSLIDATTGASTFVDEYLGRAQKGRFSGDGTKILSVLRSYGCMQISDLTDLEIQSSFCPSAIRNHPSASSSGGVAARGDLFYFGYTLGAHYNGGAGGDFSEPDETSAYLAVGSLSDLSAYKLVALDEYSEDYPTVRDVAISPDGGTVAVGVSRYDTGTNEVWIYDANNDQLVDADSETEGIQPVTLSVDVGYINHLIFTDDNSRLLVNFDNTDEMGGEGNGQHSDNYGNADGSTVADIDVIAMSDFAVTQITAPVATVWVGMMLPIGNTLLFPADAGTFFSVDLGTGTATDTLFGGGEYLGAVRDPDGIHYWLSDGYPDDGCDIYRMKISDNTPEPLENGDDSIASWCANRHGYFDMPRY